MVRTLPGGEGIKSMVLSASDIERARKDGYAWLKGHFVENIRGAAAPIFDSQERTGRGARDRRLRQALQGRSCPLVEAMVSRHEDSHWPRQALSLIETDQRRSAASGYARLTMRRYVWAQSSSRKSDGDTTNFLDRPAYQ
jgi:hypothetical protein